MTVRLSVRVQPGARREGVVGRTAGGEWKLAVRAPAVDGRANEAVVELLADALGVRRRQVELELGATARRKRFVVEGLEPADAERRLAGRMERDGE